MFLRRSEVVAIYTFNYKLSEEDYVAFNVVFQQNLIAWDKPMLKNRIFTFAFFVIAALAVFFFAGTSAWPIILTIVIFAIIFLFVPSKTYNESYVKNNIQSFVNNVKTTDGKLPFGLDIILQFDDNDIRHIDDTSEVRIKYNSVEKIEITDSAIYISYCVMQTVIMPLSVFESEAQRGEFLAFLRQKTGIGGSDG